MDHVDSVIHSSIISSLQILYGNTYYCTEEFDFINDYEELLKHSYDEDVAREYLYHVTRNWHFDMEILIAAVKQSENIPDNISTNIREFLVDSICPCGYSEVFTGLMTIANRWEAHELRRYVTSFRGYDRIQFNNRSRIRQEEGRIYR